MLPWNWITMILWPYQKHACLHRGFDASPLQCECIVRTITGEDRRDRKRTKRKGKGAKRRRAVFTEKNYLCAKTDTSESQALNEFPVDQ